MDPALPIDQGAITVKRQHIEILQAAFQLDGSSGWVGDLIGHGLAVPFVIRGPVIAVEAPLPQAVMIGEGLPSTDFASSGPQPWMIGPRRPSRIA